MEVFFGQCGETAAWSVVRLETFELAEDAGSKISRLLGVRGGVLWAHIYYAQSEGDPNRHAFAATIFRGCLPLCFIAALPNQ
jgi:hypothetical protein